MRALCFGALAVISAFTLAGCSHPAPPQLASPCVDLSGEGCTDHPVVIQPAPSAEPAKASRKSPASVARRAALQRKHARAAKRRAASQVAAAEAKPKLQATPGPKLESKPESKQDTKPTPKSTPTPADTQARTSRPDPLPPADGAPPPVISTPAPAKEAAPNAGKVQTEVMVAAVTVAAELAERMTALRVPEGPADKHLVAVLLARPNVRGVPDLSGKVIAIDERYAKSNARITAAMNAAGASEVLLLEGQATAITRLSNGEVSAAVVALASPEAAEAFPKIAGFRLFTVTLKP
ncbi:hypothetical protein [Bradyrhizobium sp. SRS-191]|uniref:hypothetical protein n=1 Tax=Bradyrhizobium sp. SRS-191 TaxID=2962606 RepID=UPI00211E6374|nr:hypothetical protein [Bradyrhizobium sp. SRS-191]